MIAGHGKARQCKWFAPCLMEGRGDPFYLIKLNMQCKEREFFSFANIFNL